MKRRFLKKPQLSDEMTLQITSMADIFTIILVFLLKSFSTSAVQISPSDGMKIPLSQSNEPPIEALKIEVAEKSILVESSPVLSLEHFKLASKDRQANQTAPALNQVLDLARKKQEFIAKANPSVKVDSKILLIADERTPYSTIKTVLASAAVSGFTDYKLVVLRKE